MGDQKLLKDMLKMSLKLTDQEVKNFEPSGNMDEERSEWLQQAIDNVLENDDAKKLATYTSMFLSLDSQREYSEKELLDVETIFEAIQFLCEGFEMANEFDRMEGLVYCLKFLTSKHTTLRWRAADLIANCVQNNVKLQSNLTTHNGIEKLLFLLKTCDEEIVKVKCLYALSTLVANFETAQKLFIKFRGIEFALKLIKETTGKVQIKSALLLQKFLWNETKFDDLNYPQIFEELLMILKEDLHDDTYRASLNSIVHLIETDKELKDLYKNKHFVLYKDFVEKRIQNLTEKDKEMYEDEIVLYEKLLKM